MVSCPKSDESSALRELARGRDFITTSEFASIISRAIQTLHKLYCMQGEAYGIRPKKVGRSLLWSVNDIESMLAGA